MSGELDSLIAELETVATRLRGREVGADEAAELVERCADLAARVGDRLDREDRAAQSEAFPGDPLPGQEELL